MSRCVTCFLLTATVCVAAPLPEFFSSEPEHDRLLNDLFVRHLRIDVSETSLKKAPGVPVPTYATCTLWRDWEVDDTLWYDATSANLPTEDRLACFRGQLETIPVDRFGYVFSAHNSPEPPLIGPQAYFGMGWPFPEYVLGLGSKAAGWEWNGADTNGWSIENGAAEARDGYLHVRSSGARPILTSPAFSANWFHAPFVMIDIAYDALDERVQAADRVFRLWWTTEREPEFSQERSVRSDAWPAIPVPELTEGFARRLWLPMYLHPEWRGETITRIRMEPLLGDGSGNVAIRLNAVRLDYDSRHAVNNPIHVRASARKFLWDGDEEWLRGQLPRMRRATEFMLTHMQGRELGLLDQSFFVGHDGLGWETTTQRRIGHGIGSNYFDIAPMGPRDLESSVMYIQALRAMAGIEAYVEAHPELDSPKPVVSTPDGVGVTTYAETAASLAALAEEAGGAIHREFWNEDTGRYGGWRDVNGELKDYGYAHFNLEALAAGVPDAGASASILSWLDGERIVEGDTSTGADIYHWRFAPRLSTRRNLLDWGWGQGRSASEGEEADEYGQTVATLSPPFQWGNQVQDGGAVLFTTFFDVTGRLNYGDTEGAWRVWRGMLDHHQEVLAHGGQGARFYRDYYEADPTRGVLQGGGTPGGLGLDEEFVESLLTPAAWATAWLGISAPEPEVLQIAPTLPEALGEVGVRNVVYRGNRLDIRAERGVIDLRGSDVLAPDAGVLRLVFRGDFGQDPVVLRDGQPDAGPLERTEDGVMTEQPLSASVFEARPRDELTRGGEPTLRASEIHIRDPWILPYEGVYYLTGTTGDAWGVQGGGFAVFTSSDLVEWTPHGQILQLDEPPTWATYQFWAPEMVERDGRFYLYYSGNSDTTHRGTGVAVADSPLGPFRNLSDQALTPLEWEALDGHLFTDVDGAEYLIYVHEWVQCEIGEMWIQAISSDYHELVGEPTMLFRGQSAPWTNNVIDGPMMVVRDGRYNLFWSSFDQRGGGYSAGIAIADELRGPYTHSEEPVITNDGGHNCVFEGFDGRTYTSFHQPNSTPNEKLRIHELLYDAGVWTLGPPVE